MDRFDLLPAYANAMDAYEYIRGINPASYRGGGNPYYWRLTEALGDIVRYGDVYGPARDQMLEGMR
jgi:hypothetical protein